MSYIGAMKRAIHDAVMAAQSDTWADELGGFVVIEEGEEYFYLPLTPGVSITNTLQSRVVERWGKGRNGWSELLPEHRR